MKTQHRHLVILLALLLGNAILTLAQEREVIYFDLAAGPITISTSSYSGKVYQNNGESVYTVSGTHNSSNRYYVYQSTEANKASTGYSGAGGTGTVRVPTYDPVMSPDGTETWKEYITGNKDVEAIVTNWPTCAAAVNKASTANTITITTSETSDVDMVIDGIWSSFDGTTADDAPLSINTTSNWGGTTIRLKGDNRLRNIYYYCTKQNQGYLRITSADDDEDDDDVYKETGTLTVANLSTNSYGWNGMTMIGPGRGKAELGLVFQGGTVFAGFVKQMNSAWVSTPGDDDSKIRFTSCVGASSNSLGQVKIKGGILTAVSNGTSPAIGGGGGINGEGSRGWVDISGGKVYAYSMGVYSNERSAILPVVAIGGGGTFNGNACGEADAGANVNPSEINITGGYVFAQSVGGPAIGGGSSLHNRSKEPSGYYPSNGGKAIINISGGAIVEAYSVDGTVGGHAAVARSAIGGGDGYSHAGDVELTISGEETEVTATSISGGNATRNESGSFNAGKTTVTVNGGMLDCNFITGGYRNYTNGLPGTVTLTVNDGVLRTGYVYGGTRSTYNATGDVGKVDVTINGGTIQGQFALSNYSSDGSTFTMTGGTIDNTGLGAVGAVSYPRKRPEGGAVFSSHRLDVINISGGTITNCSGTRGGAIYFDAGTLTMTGGTITGNTATTNGGGVYKLGSMIVSGNPKVKGNTVNGQANNVYIPGSASEPYVIYGSGLTCGAQIGVTKTETDHAYSSGSGTMKYTNITQLLTESTSRGVPIYINSSNTEQRCEFIVPASGLIPIRGKTIKALTFYLATTASSTWGSPKFLTYMVEVRNTTLSEYHTGGELDSDLTTLTRVCDNRTPGDITNSTITITFINGGSGSTAYQDHYDYVGGNLLIGNLSRDHSGAISSNGAAFSVISAPGASASGSVSSGGTIPFNQRDIIPKVTFTLSDDTDWTYPDDCYATVPSSITNQFFFDDTQSCKVCSSSCDASLSPYTLYFVKNADGDDSWQRQAPSAVAATDYTLNAAGTHVASIQTGLGLAYFASQVLSGMDYTDQTVTLTNDIDLDGHNWEPAGFCATCGDEGTSTFAGTFDGQGHTIYNLNCSYDYKNVGLFGHVTGTVKNVIVSGTFTGSATNVGGIAGEVDDGGEIYNSISTVTPTIGTNFGSFVGKINSGGSLKNSFANTTCTNGLVGSNAGTVENCYVRGTTVKVGTGTASDCYASTDGTDGDYTAVVTPYVYGTNDNLVSSTDVPLVKTLNTWVGSSDKYAKWARPTTTTINGNYPILKMPGQNAVAANSDTPAVLHYNDVNTLIGSYDTDKDAIYLYGSMAGVSSNSGLSAKLIIDEDAAITQAGPITATVGVTLKNTQDPSADSWDWHMFSSALTAAPLGVTYADNAEVGYGVAPTNYTFNNSGYFPTIASANYGEIDFYCYYEPEYHWINFKRNGNSHWHEDGGHEQIHYQATPSAAQDVNESTLISGKGYLMALKQETFLQATGTLNNGTIGIDVTKGGAYRTGYNFLGNPYQSYLDFDAFAAYTDATYDNRNLWENNSVSKASYIILDKDGYHSYAYNQSTNNFAPNQYLHPHQGFMIIVKGNATKAAFDNSMRNTTATAAFRDDRVNYPLVNLIATGEDGNRDITTVELGRPDKGGAHKAYDLHLGKGSIYTHYEDQDYAIAFTQPGITEVGIWFEADEEATFTMTWDMENGDFHYLHLIDNMTGSDIDCLSATEYRFTAMPEDYKSRFRLKFGYTGIEEPEEDGTSTGASSFAFRMGDWLVVNGEGCLEVIDMTGRTVWKENVHGSQATVPAPKVPTGVYVLRLTGSDGVRTQKIVLAP